MQILLNKNIIFKPNIVVLSIAIPKHVWKNIQPITLLQCQNIYKMKIL